MNLESEGPEVFLANTDADINACFPVFLALRPHLIEANFLAQVRRQQTQSYQVLAVRNGSTIQSVAGFRLAEYLVWGKVLYIDDLSTLPSATGKGFASVLIDWMVDYAKQHECNSVQLDTGYARHTAHKLYLAKGFTMHCHHLALNL